MILSNKDAKFFEIARKLSFKSTHYRYKLGCVIVKKNHIVGLGFNESKTDRKSPHAFKTIHAEYSATKNVPYQDLFNSTVYVYRESKNGSLAPSKPCIFCHKMLEELGIDRVCYTMDTGFHYYEYKNSEIAQVSLPTFRYYK